MQIITYVCDICHRAITPGSILFSGVLAVGAEQVTWHACGKYCAIGLLKKGIDTLENWENLTDKTSIESVKNEK